MNKKVFTIFLDIDGVINSLDSMRSLETLWRAHCCKMPVEQWKEHINIKYSSNERSSYHFDERCKRYFNAICEFLFKKYGYDSTEINIVITSCWQNHGIDKMREIWKKEELLGNIADISNVYSYSRLEAIKLYNQQHNITGNWCVIDDDGSVFFNNLDESEQFRNIVPKSDMGITYHDMKNILFALTDKETDNIEKLYEHND